MLAHQGVQPVKTLAHIACCQAKIHPHAGRQVDHTRNTASTVRNVVPSTPVPMRNRSPLANTSSSAASAADSCRAALLSTKAKRTGSISFLQAFAPGVEGIFCQPLFFAELLHGHSAALLRRDSLGPLVGFTDGYSLHDDVVGHQTTMQRLPARTEEGFVGRLRIRIRPPRQIHGAVSVDIAPENVRVLDREHLAFIIVRLRRVQVNRPQRSRGKMLVVSRFFTIKPARQITVDLVSW